MATDHGLPIFKELQKSAMAQPAAVAMAAEVSSHLRGDELFGAGAGQEAAFPVWSPSFPRILGGNGLTPDGNGWHPGCKGRQTGQV